MKTAWYHECDGLKAPVFTDDFKNWYWADESNPIQYCFHCNVELPIGKRKITLQMKRGAYKKRLFGLLGIKHIMDDN